MGSFKDQALEEIRSDYVHNKKDILKSFLAQYLIRKKKKQEKTSETGKRHDWLAEFLLAEKRYRDKEFDTETFLKRALSFCKAKQGTAKQKKELLRIIEALEQGKDTEEIQKDIDAACIAIRKGLVQVVAREWMYNLGFPLSKNEEGKKVWSQRTKNTALDLIDAWYSKGKAVSEKARDKTDPSYAFDLDKYEKLYEQLRKDPGRANVFLPVRIDSRTGYGIYIVGKEHFANQDVCGKDSCGLVIFRDFYTTNEQDDNLLTICYLPYDGEELPPNVEEANDWFELVVLKNKLEETDIFEMFKFFNGNSPEKMDDNLSIYFVKPGEDPFKNTEEYIESVRSGFLY